MENKVRKSNFELLRIIAMIFIIFHHFYVHGEFNDLNSNVGIVITFLGAFGKCASILFILISGYFMVNKSVSLKKILRLMLQFLFYSLCILLFLVAISYSLTFKDIIRLIIPILFGNWFMITYIQLLLFIPFINKMVSHVNKKEYIFLILFLLFGFFIIPMFVPNNSWNLSNLGVFIFAYLLGGYLNKYDIPFKKRLLILLLMLILVFIFILIILDLIYGFSLSNLLLNICSINSIFMVILAFIVLYLFKDLSFSSNIINSISSSMLGIYLLHDNYLIRDIIWNSIFSNNNIINCSYFYILYFIKIILVFILFLILDKILYFIFNKLWNYISMYFDKIKFLKFLGEIYEK